MRQKIVWPTAALLAISLAGCGPLVPFVPDYAVVPPTGPGTINPDVTAVHQAQWAFADSGRLRGRPVEAARAVANMDYIAGKLYVSPRWAHISALTKMQLLEGRQDVRAVMGVAPGVPSQTVVNRYSAAAKALYAGDQAAAAQLLGPPMSTVSGEQVIAHLYDMPYVKMANISTMRAGNELFQNSRGGSVFFP